VTIRRTSDSLNPHLQMQEALERDEGREKCDRLVLLLLLLLSDTRTCLCCDEMCNLHSRQCFPGFSSAMSVGYIESLIPGMAEMGTAASLVMPSVAKPITKAKDRICVIVALRFNAWCAAERAKTAVRKMPRYQKSSGEA
jgi:hypothetical protein